MFDSADLLRAQKLAYFLISCPRSYLLVVVDAAERAVTQTRRQEEHFAEPPQHHPVCVNWRLRHLLQLWVCESAKEHERDAWPQENITDESCARRLKTWIIRFVRDVATWRMVELNTFRATVGLTEVLHHYDKPLQMMPEYYWIRLELAPEDAKQLNYYRRCYGALLKYLTSPQRFGSLLTIEKDGVKNRICSRPDSQGFDLLVRDALREHFTLWETAHPDEDELEKSYYHGSSIRGHSVAEEIRTHRLLCPECFSQITSTLKICQPEQRLRLPHFTMSDDFFKGPPSGERLSDEDASHDLSRLQSSLERKARQRTQYKPGEVCLYADGELIGTWDLTASSQQTITVNREHRILEVRSFDGLLLATHFVPYDDLDEVWQADSWTVKLEGGQQFSFKLKLNAEKGEEESNAEVNITYCETAPLRAAKLQWARLKHRLTKRYNPFKWISLSNNKAWVPVGIPGEWEKAQSAGFHNSAGIGAYFLGYLQRPGLVTIGLSLLLATMLVFLWPRGEKVSAAMLLEKAAAAEQAQAKDGSLVTHRILSLTERDPESERVTARRRLEILQQGTGGLNICRVYDENGRLLAGEWRHWGIIYENRNKGRSAPTQRRAPLKDSHLALSVEPSAELKARLDDIHPELGYRLWQLEPSAKSFLQLIRRTDLAKVKVEERPDAWIIRYVASPPPIRGLLQATLVLNRKDLRAREERLVLKQDDTAREYLLVEESIERKPIALFAAKTFEPDPGLIITATARQEQLILPVPNSPTPSGSLPASPATPASPELEIQIHTLLTQIGADLGREVTVRRTTDGRLHLEGVIATTQRKEEILRTLAPIAKDPAVVIEIETNQEALKRLKPKVSDSNANDDSDRTIVTGRERFPAFEALQQHLLAKGIAVDQIPQEANRLARKLLDQSNAALLAAKSLEDATPLLPRNKATSVEAEAKKRLFALIEQRALAAHRRCAGLRKEMEAIFRSKSGAVTMEQIDTANPAELIRAIEKLAALALRLDWEMRVSLTIGVQTTLPAIDAPEFWRLLYSAESLAASIQAAAHTLTISASSQH